MTQPCVFELTAAGLQKPATGLRQLFELTNKASTGSGFVRAHPQKGWLQDLHDLRRRRGGRDGRPARRTGQFTQLTQERPIGNSNIQGPPSSEGPRAELIVFTEKITFCSAIRMKKGMLFSASVSAPHENPQILEVLRLRP